MTVPMGFFFAALMILAYVVAPVMLFWGWVRWTMHRPRTWTIPSTLSFAGFIFASASGFFALCLIANGANWYEHNRSGIAFCIVIGAAFSAFGLLLAVGGLWRNSSLRWHAPVCAIAMLAFWLIATTWD